VCRSFHLHTSRRATSEIAAAISPPTHLPSSTTKILELFTMAPTQPAAKLEREKKLKSIIGESSVPANACHTHSHLVAFGSSLTKRLENERDTALVNDFQTQIRGLPLQPSSTLTARQDELDKLGTELWNLSTRLRRDESGPDGRAKEEATRKNRVLCLLRVFSFLVLDSAAAQAKGRPRKSCIRLMKVALKAARVCIDSNEMSNATKILERAAEYQDILSQKSDGTSKEECEAADRLRLEYFAIRTTLVSDYTDRDQLAVFRPPLIKV